mmetsp:Transcript_70/g.50  ORF Transcript_70/g.50 Transcript_70/m.50 type:complete len:113 (-) Transcript_70:175-513(-)
MFSALTSNSCLQNKALKPVNVFSLLNDSISSAELQQQKASFLKQDSKSDSLTSGANVCNDRSTGVKTRENRYCVGRNSVEDRILPLHRASLWLWWMTMIARMRVILFVLLTR